MSDDITETIQGLIGGYIVDAVAGHVPPETTEEQWDIGGLHKQMASELGVDLIVLGHRQRLSFAARWWKGSVGASLLDYAPCSILIARGR